MEANSMDMFEKTGFEKVSFEKVEKMDAINKSFKTSVKPENGAYGTIIIDKGNGLTEYLSRNELGHIRKDYFRDGQKYMTREKISNGNWVKTYYDDMGTAYKTENVRWGKNTPSEVSTKLTGNTEIVKGNFTSKTDVYGRPISNKVRDLQLRDSNTARQSLSKNLNDSSYREGGLDQRGHIISDQFGGPASKENVLAQNKIVNHGKFREVERTIEQLKAEGHKVDYEVKINYADNSIRPSSYEPKITVDGKIYKLGSDLKKIYNEESTTKLSEIKITAKENVQKVKSSMNESNLKAHETGKKEGLEAAVITCAVSTVDNVSSYIEGNISADEMAINIVKDTGIAGTLGYGVGFVSDKVASAMSASSHKLINGLGQLGIPGSIVSFGVDCYDSVIDYAQGEIDGKELAYDLGESAVGIAGAAATGALVGSVIPGAGTVVGAAAGLVGSMVGYAVASEAYATAVEVGSKYVDKIGEKAQEVASATVERAAEFGTEVADTVTNAIKDFNIANALPFHI